MSEAEEVVTEAAILHRAENDGRNRHFPCKGCGFQMEVKPGVDVLHCPSCGAEEAIPLTEAAIREQALHEYVPPARKRGLRVDGLITLRCASCGATSDAPASIATSPCAYCGGHLEDVQAAEETITPEAVIPFAIDRRQAEAALRAWVAKLWFAPSDLKHLSGLETFQDHYLPYFTFDSHTLSHYQGQAGYHYYVTVGSGKNRRSVRKTRWHWRSGVHEQFFDDVLVPAGSFGIGDEGWRTTAARPFAPERLAGITTRRAAREPTAAWADAKQRMDREIHQACRRRIGGDTQRSVTVQTAHRGVTWKLLLAPRWEGGYRYRNRRFAVTVNGQTATVVGNRPWSVAKITIAIATLLLVIGIVILLVWLDQRPSPPPPRPVAPPMQWPEPAPPPADIPVER